MCCMIFERIDYLTKILQILGAVLQTVHPFSGAFPSQVSTLGIYRNSASHFRQPIFHGKRNVFFKIQMQQSTSTRSESDMKSSRLRSPFGDTRSPNQIVDEFQKLLQEGVRIAGETSPRVGIARTIQAARAVLFTGVELAQRYQGRGIPTVETLQVDAPAILRQLFERLGSTVRFF